MNDNNPIQELVQRGLDHAQATYNNQSLTNRSATVDYYNARHLIHEVCPIKGKIALVKKIKDSNSALGLKQAKFLAEMIINGYSTTYGGIEATNGDNVILLPIIWNEMLQYQKAEFMFRSYFHLRHSPIFWQVLFPNLANEPIIII